MMSSRIKLRHLSAFQEVARRRSLVKAAHALSISQPALSKTIRELEEILDTSLFERSPQGMALTSAGLALLRYAGPALSSLEEGVKAVGQIARGRVVRLGALSSVEAGFLPRALVALHRAWPELRLQVTTGPSAFLLSRLRQGELDLVVGRMSDAREIRDLSFEHLYYEPLVMVVRPGHPLVGMAEAELTATVLNDFPWVVPPVGTTLRERVEQFWVEQGAAPARIMLETLSLPLSRRYCLDSDALWLAPLDAISPAPGATPLCRLPVTLESRGGSVGLCINSSLPLTAGAEALRRFLCQQALADTDDTSALDL
ncbi:pca operon transcription factor PcaQ [Larsenimonas rhizosphaerae]|uniref:pca operon transcription factor PcaQ n=1 Tax=Larsenimonas rhizosphaerae TaxID=2944682 RepID=UPI00203375F0|nr:pca operon transcription factor PcaQ [Larsenimonas rhizosphaerae]MCM2131527.1 pca operon transcription factor PcaQ [Larsenimonas rhizosphaerae]